MTLPELASISNFREMGGLPAADGTIRTGRLFRSAHLADVTDDDLATLVDLDIRTIVDFRNDADLAGDGGADRVPDGVEHLRLPMSDSGGRMAELRDLLTSGDEGLIDKHFGDGKALAIATEAVASMALSPELQQRYGRFLAMVAEPDRRPILWHCSAGKDRAGWAATLLGMALGVADDVLVDHYLESNKWRPWQERLDLYAERGIDVEVLKPFMIVDAAYIRRGFEAIDEQWPSRLHYLDEAMGLGPDLIAALRSDLII